MHTVTAYNQIGQKMQRIIYQQGQNDIGAFAEDFVHFKNFEATKKLSNFVRIYLLNEPTTTNVYIVHWYMFFYKKAKQN